MRVGTGELAGVAAGAVLQAPQCTQDVRWLAAECQESIDSINEAADGRRGLPERLCRFVAEGDPVVHQSANGTSIVIPSFATTVSLKTSRDRKSTRLNSSHGYISYAVFCLKKKKQKIHDIYVR